MCEIDSRRTRVGGGGQYCGPIIDNVALSFGKAAVTLVAVFKQARKCSEGHGKAY